MTKLYGLVGAHRTGKTTLAKAVAEELGVPFHKTTVSDTLKQLMINPQVDLAFRERLTIQEIILDDLARCYKEAIEANPEAPIVIVDRTPLDVLGYTRSEILRETMNPTLDRLMSNHEQRCIELTNFHFAGLCLVQPGIPLIADSTKGSANVHYQRHVHATMLDAVLDDRLKIPAFVLGSGNVDLTSRVSDTVDECEAIITELQTVSERKQQILH